jgi:C1A family cysteine protease
MSAFQVRGLGYKPDPPKAIGQKPDHDAAPTLGTAPPPPAASNVELVVEVLDQGQAGSCVAHAIPQAVRMAHVRAGIASPRLMSRNMGYWLSRSLDGTQNEDDGTYLRSFFTVLKAYGFCPESVWPYDLAQLYTIPPAAAFRAAYDQNNPTVYQRIMTAGAARIDDIKRAIAAGYGVCFGTDVSEAFCQNQLGDGPIPPPTTSPIAGGHALCAVAYDGDTFRIVNSWSPDWGDRGYCTFSADYMAWDRTNDLWIVAQAPNYSE